MEHGAIDTLVIFAATFFAHVVVGMDVKAEVRALRVWAVELADHLHFKRPPRPARAKSED